MATRQTQLLIGLAVGALLLVSSWAYTWLMEPLRQLREDVAAKQASVKAKDLQVLAIEQAKTKLRDWQLRSPAPDPGRKERPSANEALRQYTEWATELAHSVALDEVTVTPQSQSVGGRGVYVEVVVEIDGEGRYSQFLQLLERFYRVDILQRINSIRVTSMDVVGDPPVQFQLNVAVLALAETTPLGAASARRPTFIRTTLSEPLDAAQTALNVTAGEGFPSKTPFRIRIERELLDVTEAAGTKWTVVRGVERTEAAAHPERSTASLVRTEAQRPELSREEFRKLIAENIFVKPTPPMQYDFQFGPFAPPPVVRGKPWDFSIAAKEFDPSRGEPAYQFVGDVPPGLAVNAATGQLTWKLESGVKDGEYPVTVEVRHPSADGGRESQKVTLTVAEPNTPPKFAKVDRPTAFRGQPFRIEATATDEDKPAQKLTFKLGPGAPKDAKVDARTGKVEWTPGEDHSLGPAKIAVVATDSGTPPQSTTLNLSVEVKEDAARLTELVGIVGVGDKREAMLSDKTQDRTTMHRVGDEFKAADVTVKIVELDAETATVEIGGKSRKMKLGDNVRSLTAPAKVTRRGSDETLP